MKTLLVTGGAGFIGSNFIRYILAQGNTRVINLDKLTYAGNLSSLIDIIDNHSHKFFRGGIEDRQLVYKLLSTYRPSAIVNFAAESHVDRSIDAPGDFIHTNVVGVFQLLEAALAYWKDIDGHKRENFRFLHVSTDEVYGSLGATGLFSENTPYAPNSPYSASKAASDHLVRAYHHTYGLPVLTTNCSNNYGPYQFPEKMVPLVITNAIKGKTLPIYGDGQNIRDWLFVLDHCTAIQTVLEKGKPGEAYNLGGGNERTNLELVYGICDLLDEIHPRSDKLSYRKQMIYVKDRPGHDRRYAIDFSKIKGELRWQPQETFETGLRKTVHWYLDNQQWCDRIFDGSYKGEHLGLDIAL